MLQMIAPLLLLVILIPLQCAVASELPGNVQLLLDPQYESIPRARSFLHSLREQLIESHQREGFGTYPVKVVIGSKTLDGALESLDNSTSLVVAQINSFDYINHYADKFDPISVVFSDVDPRVQYELARTLVPKGIIVAVETQRTRHLTADIPAYWILIDADDSISDLIRRLPLNTSAFLLLNDSSFVNSGNIRLLRDSLFRRNIPIIGFSESLIAMGSVLVAYPTSEAQIKELVRRVRKASNGTQEKPGHVDEITILTNENAAKAHFLSLENVATEVGE